MSRDDVFPAELLRRKAIVYVRQSTTQQVNTNLDSQRRQYELVLKRSRELVLRWCASRLGKTPEAM